MGPLCFAAAMLLFLLPFVTFSCEDLIVARVTGAQMLVGAAKQAVISERGQPTGAAAQASAPRMVADPVVIIAFAGTVGAFFASMRVLRNHACVVASLVALAALAALFLRPFITGSRELELDRATVVLITSVLIAPAIGAYSIAIMARVAALPLASMFAAIGVIALVWFAATVDFAWLCHRFGEAVPRDLPPIQTSISIGLWATLASLMAGGAMTALDSMHLSRSVEPIAPTSLDARGPSAPLFEGAVLRPGSATSTTTVMMASARSNPQSNAS